MVKQFEKFSLNFSILLLIRVNDLRALLLFIFISLVFFSLSKILFSGFLQFKGNFVDGRNNSKYPDVAPLTALAVMNRITHL